MLTAKKSSEAQQLFNEANTFFEQNPSNLEESLKKYKSALDVAPPKLQPSFKAKYDEVNSLLCITNKEQAEMIKLVTETHTLLDKHEVDKLVAAIKNAPLSDDSWKLDVKEADSDFVKALEALKSFKPTTPSKAQELETFTKQIESQHDALTTAVRKRVAIELEKRKEAEKQKAEEEQKQEQEKKKIADNERKAQEQAIQKQMDDFKKIVDESLKCVESFNFSSAAAILKEKADAKTEWLDEVKYEGLKPSEFFPAMDKLLKDLNKAQWNIITSLKKDIGQEEIFIQFIKSNLLCVKISKVDDNGTLRYTVKGNKFIQKKGVADLHPIEKTKRADIKDKTAFAIFNTVVNIDAGFYDKAKESVKGAGFLSEPLRKLIETREKGAK